MSVAHIGFQNVFNVARYQKCRLKFITQTLLYFSRDATIHFPHNFGSNFNFWVMVLFQNKNVKQKIQINPFYLIC